MLYQNNVSFWLYIKFYQIKFYQPRDSIYSQKTEISAGWKEYDSLTQNTVDNREKFWDICE